MKLDKIESDDIPQLACWNVELHEDEGSKPMTIDRAEARLRGWLADSLFKGFIISVDDRSVGYVLYQNIPPSPDLRDSLESIYIRQFYISRDERRLGYGRSAIGLFAQQAVSADQPINLDIKYSNPIGQKFWESLGFKAEHVSYARK